MAPKITHPLVRDRVFWQLVGTAIGLGLAAGVLSLGFVAVAEWWSARRELPEDQRSVNVLSGIAGGVGALVTAPFAAALLNLELGTLDHRDKLRALVPNLVAASMGFAVFYVTVGSSFLDLYEVGPYELKAWHLAAAIPLGAVAAVIMITLVAVATLVRQALDRLPSHPVLLAAGGGLAFGIAGVVLPLTLLSGKDQLADAIDQVATLSAGLLLAVLVVKVLTFSVSMATGFIGGPVMPSLFLGGVAGLAVHVLIPDLPLALTLSTMLVAVPGAVVKAPFTMMALAAITVSVGPITVAPAGIAVLTAYLLTSGLELFGPAQPEPASGSGPANQR